MEIPPAINDVQFVPDEGPPKRRATVEELIERHWQGDAPSLVPFSHDRPHRDSKGYFDMELNHIMFFGESYVRDCVLLASEWAREIAIFLQKREEGKILHFTSSYRLKVSSVENTATLVVYLYQRFDNAP
jgi:hypothetical protein